MEKEETKLSLIYDRRQKDFVVRFPDKPDGSLLMHHLVGRLLKWELPSEKVGVEYPFNFSEFNLIKELESRGYDPKTIKFSIEKKSNQ